jgi:kynurenine formamidase
MDNFKYISLSHYISETTPSYNNSGSFCRSTLTSIKNGNSANSENWNFNNHIGTHIDFPLHFFDDGKTSSDFNTQFFINNKVGFIELEKTCELGEIITINHIEKQTEKLNSNLEVLLLKTGFQKMRNNLSYSTEGPGYDKSLYEFIRKKFPYLKFFGFDSISLTSVLHRSLGKEAHLSFLNPIDPILVIEDMDLSSLYSNIILEQLIIAPILIAKSDGVPVNCILKFKDKTTGVTDFNVPYTI